ncbi:hypothetical protein [uncultured Algibacter sp.]|uniref:hypothetical protein n=1 Tax=uncultured Algibacter sp. TaxID=298659 RepID=UPI0032173A84
MKKVKHLLNLKVNIYHLILRLGLMSLLVYGVLSFILTWLCCMWPCFGSSMFSDYAIIMVLTIDFVVLLSVVVGFCKSAKQIEKITYCKSYLILGIIVFMLYIATMIYGLIIN